MNQLSKTFKNENLVKVIQYLGDKDLIDFKYSKSFSYQKTSFIKRDIVEFEQIDIYIFSNTSPSSRNHHSYIKYSSACDWTSEWESEEDILKIIKALCRVYFSKIVMGEIEEIIK